MVKSLWLYWRIIFVLSNQRNWVSSAVKLWKAYGLAQLCACVMLSGPRVQTMPCGSHLALAHSVFSPHVFEIRQWRSELFLNCLVIIHSVEDVLWYSYTCHKSVVQYEDLCFILSVFQLWCEVVIKRRGYLWPQLTKRLLCMTVAGVMKYLLFTSSNVFQTFKDIYCIVILSRYN